MYFQYQFASTCYYMLSVHNEVREDCYLPAMTTHITEGKGRHRLVCAACLDLQTTIDDEMYKKCNTLPNI